MTTVSRVNFTICVSLYLILVVTRACKAQTVGQHGWARHLWPIVILKVFFFFLPLNNKQLVISTCKLVSP
jgi:hypothetical protein